MNPRVKCDYISVSSSILLSTPQSLSKILHDSNLEIESCFNKLLREGILHGDIDKARILFGDPRFKKSKFSEVIIGLNWRVVKAEMFDAIINFPEIRECIENYLPMILIQQDDPIKLDKLLSQSNLKIDLSLLLMETLLRSSINDDILRVIIYKLGKINHSNIYHICKENKKDLLRELLNNDKVIINGSNYNFMRLCVLPDDIIAELINSRRFNEYFTIEIVMMLSMLKKNEILLKLVKDNINPELNAIIARYISNKYFLDVFNELKDSDIKRYSYEFMFISIEIDSPEAIKRILEVINYNDQNLNIFFERCIISGKWKSLVEISTKFNGITNIKRNLLLVNNVEIIDNLLKLFPIDMELIETLFIKSIINSNNDIVKLLCSKYKFDQSLYEEAAITSIYFNNSEIFDILVNDYKIDPKKNNDLMLKMACYSNRTDILKKLLKISEIDPSVNFNECFHLYGNSEIKAELIKDKRVFDKLMTVNINVQNTFQTSGKHWLI